MTDSKQKRDPVLVILLALQPVLLAIIGWFSVRTVDSVEVSVRELVRGQTEAAKDRNELTIEVREMKATINAWAKQEFVPQSLFNALKEDTNRRLASLEKGK